MSNEELFAAIHKSKRRLNIRDGPDGQHQLSPATSLGSLGSLGSHGSLGSLVAKTNRQQQSQPYHHEQNPKEQQQLIIGTRHSWSPESQKMPEIPRSSLSVSPTSRLDFKRLLLQQSIKSGPGRVSAAEQLKLSRQQCQEQQQQQHSSPQPASPQQQQQQQQHQHHHHQQQQYQHNQQQQQQHQHSPVTSKSNQQLTKVMSPRSGWRFHTPRTDVLSSTIIEDTAAEEKAMKPSPDNSSLDSKPPYADQTSALPMPITTRQVDLSRETKLNTNNSNSDNCAQLGHEGKMAFNDNKHQQQQQQQQQQSHQQPQPRALEKREKELENRLQAIDFSSSSMAPATITVTSTTNNKDAEDPIKAIESRRISNQLARAQFLASSGAAAAPGLVGPSTAQGIACRARFRARSESPQQQQHHPQEEQQQNPQPSTSSALSGSASSLDVAQLAGAVTRSPSAPTLETAL